MRTKRKKKFHRFLLKSFLIILLVLSVFIMLSQKSTFTAIEYRISKLEKKKTDLLRERKYLLTTKASLSSIGNIKKADGKTEDFHFPDRTRIVYVKTTKEPEPIPASYPVESKRPQLNEGVK